MLQQFAASACLRSVVAKRSCAQRWSSSATQRIHEGRLLMVVVVVMAHENDEDDERRRERPHTHTHLLPALTADMGVRDV
jgi:hypothetical protein